MTKNKKARPQAKRMGGRKIKGKGNYQTFNLRGMAQRLDQALSAIPKGTFAKKGAQMGAKYGPLGALAGRGMGAGLAAVTGYGNYSVRSNSLGKMSTSVDMIPQFVKNDHSIRVTHREFIRDLVVPNDPSTFSLQSFLINPANKELFPWLATMARQYSQYKIHGMVFAYKTMSSDITAGGSLGTVVLATNYNSIDRAFVNKIEMENSEFAVSTKPSMSLIHAIECDPKYSGLDVLYVRDPSYETTDTNDKRFYDYGRFQIATTGLPGAAGTTMGEMWVSYDIEFMKPIIGGTGLPGYIPGTSLVSTNSGVNSVGTGSQGIQTIRYEAPSATVSPTTVDGLTFSSFSISGAAGIDTVVISPGTNTLTLRKNGRYRVTYHGAANTTAAAYVWPSTATAALIALPATLTGTAAATVTLVAGVSAVPSVGVIATATGGYTYMVAFTVIVTGISVAADTVVLTPSTFTTNSSVTVASITKRLTVDWSATGVNQQDPSFV